MLARIRKLLLPLVVIIAALLPSTVFAIDNPTTIVITQVRGYRDAQVAGDLLIVGEYLILYSVGLPDETIQEAFVGRFLDGATELATTSLYPFVIPNLGYDRGLIGFYFDTEPVPATGLELVIQGNPSLFPTPSGNRAANSGIEFRSKSTIVTDLRLKGLILESAWRITDITTDIIEGTAQGLRLTPDGEEYFTNTIPLVRSVAGGLFQSNVFTPSVQEETFTNVYADSIRDYWVGTDFDNAVTGLADYIDTPKIIFTTAMLMLVATAIAFYVIQATQNSGMGVMSGIVVLCIGAIVGWTTFQFVALLGLIGALAIGYVFFYQKSTS